MADGLWGIPFPGSVTMGVALLPQYFSMPEGLAASIHRWQENLDGRDPTTGPEDENFDYASSDAEGLALAKKVKLFLGDDYYVEYSPFREISIRDSNPVELDIPKFVTDLSR